MSLYLKQNNTRSELQEKIAKELQERAKQKPQPYDAPDGVEDSSYIEGTKQTTSLAGLWLGIAILVVAIVLVIIFISI